MSRYKGRLQPQALHAIEIAFGINTHESLVHAYFTYLGNILRGRFGTSLTFFPDSVAHQVFQALPWTLGLVTISTLVSFSAGTVLGALIAWPRAPGILRRTVPLLVPVTINAIVGAEDTIDAMDLRGFGTGPRTWLRGLAFDAADWLTLAGFLLIFAVVTWLSFSGLTRLWVPPFLIPA